MSSSRERAPAPAPEPASAPESPPTPESPSFAWQRSRERSTAGDFAQIAPGTELWTSPRARVAVARATREGVVQVFGEVDGFVEVGLDWLPDPAAAHCGPPLYSLGLRVFVRKDDLVDVVTEAQGIDFGDGTGFNVAPGVPVEPRGDLLALSAGTLWRNRRGIHVVAPAASGLQIGKIYTPARASQEHGGLLGPGRVRAGEREYKCAAGTPVFAHAEHDPGHVLYGVECLQIAGFYTPEASAEEPWIVDPADTRSAHDDTAVDLAGAIGKGGAAWEFRDLYEIPAGAALTWPNGAPAGTSVRKLWIQRRPIRRGSRRCFTLALSKIEDSAMIEFCVGARVARFIG
ncbi:MAG: hypothetical protein R3B09_20485 [Nannocystaceae bacterium]